MTRARNIIQEILEINQRRRFGHAMSELSFRRLDLELAFKKFDKNDTELLKYFPVALVACIESYFRMAIKDLMDAGDPYLSNAEKVASKIKLDFTILRAIHGKRVTVGEFVAHAVPLSQLEHIEAILSEILGKSFLSNIRSVVDRWDHEVKGNPAVPILSNPDQVFSDVARTFELRHIICHEFASSYEVQAQEITRCFDNCTLFLHASMEYISEMLYPNSPLTQTDMNIAAGEELNKVRQKLDELVTSLRSMLNADQQEMFDGVQLKWQAYCDAWANFKAGDQFSGGTMWSMVYAGAAQAVVEKRIEELLACKKQIEALSN